MVLPAEDPIDPTETTLGPSGTPLRPIQDSHLQKTSFLPTQDIIEASLYSPF